MTWGERRRAVAPDGAAISWWSYGDGPPLLLVAGQAVDHRSWDRALTGLGAGRRVLVYDHRGIGDSERGDGSRYSTRRLAEDAVSVLDDAGVDRADVLGHSMGGRIAQWLAIDHAERVGRLVLAATSAGDRHTPARDPEADEILRSGETGRLAQLFFPAARTRSRSWISLPWAAARWTEAVTSGPAARTTPWPTWGRSPRRPSWCTASWTG